MSESRFTMHARVWYAYTMLPGYLDGFSPYHSPIYVGQVKPLATGQRKLKIKFYNAGYASGVRDFELDLKIIYRGATYLIADLGYDGRCVIIGQLSLEWLRQHVAAEIHSVETTRPIDVQSMLSTNHRL